MANDANIIKIKRSGTSGAPASLKLGELAYSYLTATGNPTSNGGDRLFIGANGVNGGTGNANDVIVIGGKYFTDMLDHERGILTASSALVVDANKKLDELLVDNLSLNGNTLSTTVTNGDLTIRPDGTGSVLVTSNKASSSTSTGALVVTGGVGIGGDIYVQGAISAQSASFASINNTPIGNTTPSTGAFNLLDVDNIRIDGNAIASTDTNGNITVTPNGTGKTVVTNLYIGDASTSLQEYIYDQVGGTITSGNGVDVTFSDVGNTTTLAINTEYAQDLIGAMVSGNSETNITVTYDDPNGKLDFSVATATSSVLGVASFDATDFTVTTGAVTVNAERIQDIVGAMVSTNVESGISVTYDDPNGKLDFNVNDPVITIAGDVDGFATMTNLGDTTITVTLDTVNTNVGTFGSATAIPVVTVNGKGLVTSVTTASISTSLSIAGTSGTDTVALGTDTLTFAGNGAISTAVTDNQVAISVATATSSVKGVASFNTASFAVTTGDVTIKSAGVTNAQLVNSSLYIGTTQVTLGDVSGTTSSLGVNISGKASTAGTADQVANSVTFAATGGAIAGTTFNGSAARTIDYSTIGAAPAAGSSSIVTVGTLTSGSIGAGFTAIANARLANSSVTVGSTSISLGASSTTLAGLTQVDVNNIRITGNTISSTDTNGNINLAPNGTGTIDAGNVRITNLADPTGAQDAATKAYVDAVKTGLDVKGSVRAATTANITLTNTQTVDGVALSVGDRVLVKNQTTASQNGIYVVASGAWTRAADCDNTPGTEVTSGLFTFVEEGTANADSGWVLTTDGTITLGTTGLSFVQFSGAGQITAGAGLSKTGNTLDVNVANGIEIVGDNVQLASTVAGDGLTYTSGVLAVVGTSNRISVSADAIDISSSYVGQNTITTLGTVTTGTWNGSLIGATYGGTGVNNGANTITIGGNVSTGGAVTFSGAYGFTGTLTAATSVTFPTTGTLVNTAVTALSSLATVGTITSGTWNGTAIGYAYGGTGQTTYAKGDFLYASAANTLSKLTAGTNGQTLQLQDGVPFWGDLDGGTY